MTHFDKLRRWLRTIPNINRGGCAFAALAMYKVALAEGFNPHLVYLYDEDDAVRYNGNREFMKGTSPFAYTCSHAVVEIDGILYDCQRMVDEYVRHDHVSEALVLKSVESIEGWNSCFIRDGWVDKINKAVEITLKNIKNEKAGITFTDPLPSISNEPSKEEIDSGRDLVRYLWGEFFPHHNIERHNSS